MPIFRARTPIILPNSATPAQPTSGNTIWSSKIAGTDELQVYSPSGVSYGLEGAFWSQRKIMWRPQASTAVIWFGGADGAKGGSVGAGTQGTVAAQAQSSYLTFGSLITTQNQQVGVWNTTPNYRRGSSAGLGGFFFFARASFSTIKTNERFFAGMAATTQTMVTADPSTRLDFCGFGFDVADTAFTFMHNDNSGTATKDAISGQAAFAANQLFDFYIFCKPNDTVIYYRMDTVIVGTTTTLIDTSTSTDLPRNTVSMQPACVMSNGTANTAANDANIGINTVYVESDL